MKRKILLGLATAMCVAGLSTAQALSLIHIWAIQIMEQYDLTHYHDSIMQTINYAILLTDMGQPHVSLSALKKIGRVVRKYNSEMCIRDRCCAVRPNGQ